LADKLGLATAGTPAGFAALAVAVTDGPYPAYLVPLAVDGAAVGAPQLQQQHTVFPTPPLPRPLANPIGAGDAVASGTLLRWCDTVPAAPAATTAGTVAELTEAFAWGLACGAASCLTTENSVLALDDALALRAAIVPRPQG